MKIEDLRDKKILILGLGKEGMDTLIFLKKIFPEKEIGIADQDPNCQAKISHLHFKKIHFHLGKNYLTFLKDYDLIIKSPGVPIHLPEVEECFLKKKITSQTEIFFENCPGKIIGITGTKGKSTTTYLIYKILKEGGLRAHLIGNIGKPVLNLLFSVQKDDIFVYELSSHQLYNLKRSPHVAVFLNIFPEHLDYYLSFEEYLMAKSNIFLWQKENDYLVYNEEDENIKKIVKRAKSKKIGVKKPYDKILEEVGIKKFPFVGKFYYLNVAVSIEVGKIFGIEKKKIKKAIETFKPLPHRLEYVGCFRGIHFYNDSLSTIPETTIAALEALGKRVETLILGGFDRGLSFEKLAKEILNRKIKNLILFPVSGDRIWREILNHSGEKKLPKTFMVQNMSDAVDIAFKLTSKGKICLLSPASPSFGLFKNYKERGDLFKKYVKYYGKKA